MKTHSLWTAISCLATATLLSSFAWGNNDGKPEEVSLKDKRWKQSSNLTIKTLNNTKRTVDLKPANGREQFAYIRAEKNNKESFRITCKFIPKVHEETDVVMTVKAKWKLSDQKKTLPEQETEQDWAKPHEADLADIQPDNAYAVTSTMFVEKKSAENESEVEKTMGQPHHGLIYDADLTLGVKTMTFNTYPGKIENDAFDVVDQVKGRVINNTPEFKDGKQVSSSTIVVYPVETKPIVKVKLQMISKRLTADQLQELDWKAEAASHQQGKEEESIPRENILPDLKLGDSGTLSKETQDKILFLEGDFSPKDTLGKTMVRGKIDLDWNLKLGEDTIKMEKKTRSKINTAFRVLRTKEIVQSGPGDTKIWPKGIIVATDILMKIPDSTSWWQCSQPDVYAKTLTKSVYEKSVYPIPIERNFHTQNTVGTEAHYNIYLGRMIEMYYDTTRTNKIICVEAAAMFRSCYNLVTDGTATAASIARPRGVGHQFGMLGGKVYDPTPVPEQFSGRPFPNASLGNLSLAEYVREWNKKAPENNKWFIKREETKHKISN